MEKCSFCDKSHSVLSVVQVVNLVFICESCISLMKTHIILIDRYSSPPPTHQNQLCQKCFLKPPDFFQVTSKYMKKVCDSCRSLTRKIKCNCKMALFCEKHFMKGRSVVFIKIKWQNFLKSRENLWDYNQVKYELSKLKEKFKKKDEEIDNEIFKIKELESLIKKGISECIMEKESKISIYKKELNTILDYVPKQIKDHELTGKYSKYHALLESTENRESFFKQEIFWQSRMNDISKFLDDKIKLELFSLDRYF